MNRAIITLLASIFLSSCSATYKKPEDTQKVFEFENNISVEDAMSKIKQVLILEGFEISYVDSESGIISTAAKDWRLEPSEANCGSTMGIDYLKDKRTATRVAINVIVDPKHVSIRSNIEGEYKPGSASQDITLTCVSKGNIERMIFDRSAKL